VALTVVVLPTTWTAVVPAAAIPALRSAAQVRADHTVPEDVRTALGVPRSEGGWIAFTPAQNDAADVVVFTTDPASPLAEHAGAVITSPEPPGSALLDAVAVMDRLRSPGGCPWDAEQTHTTLLPYLVEECYELYQAIEDGDRADMREELGDVLLQVLFHARVAAEESFGIDEVAADLVTKLVSRHPHVFAGTERIDTAERQELRWDELKRVEKQRESSVDGVPLGQPAVALAAKLTSRTAKAGLPAGLLPAGSGVGEQLFALAAAAKLAGIDPEAQLRGAARRFADAVRAAEQAAKEAGEDPHALDASAWTRHWPT
jgi:XTP/dITP diphosphohydrolase